MAPAHKVTLLTAFTVVVGFTVMLNNMGAPEQVTLLTVTAAVTDTWEVNALLLLGLAAVKTGTAALPLAPKPIAMLALFHENVEPATGLVKLMTEDCAPAQSDTFACGFTPGFGMTCTVNVCGTPGQATPFAV